MVTIQLNWTTNRDDWIQYTQHIGIEQKEIAAFLGITPSALTPLVTLMTTHKGVDASKLQRDRWKRAVAYVKMCAAEKEETK